MQEASFLISVLQMFVYVSLKGFIFLEKKPIFCKSMSSIGCGSKWAIYLSSTEIDIITLSLIDLSICYATFFF